MYSFIGWLYAIKPDPQLIKDAGIAPTGLEPGFTLVDDNYYIYNVDMLR
jgi:hypothetical protein